MEFITSTDSPSIAKTEAVTAAAVILLFSLAALRPSIRGHDGFGHYAWILSIASDGDLDFANQYAAWDVATGGAFSMSASPTSPRTGLPANRYGIGTALFQAPAVLLVHSILSARSPELATGLTRPYEWAVGISTAFWTGLGLWLLYLHLRRRHSATVTAITVSGIALATPLCFYAWMHGSMSHGVSFFASVLLLVSLDAAVTAPTPRAAAVLGFACALVVMTRIQDAGWVPAVCIFFLLPLRNRDLTPGRIFPLFLVLAAAEFVLFLPQLAAWKLLYGSWLSGPSPYTDGTAGKFTFGLTNIPRVLFSERGGFLAWHPILIAGIFGLIAILRGSDTSPGRQGVAASALLGLTIQVILISCWSMWWAGASFGNRFFISAYPFLAVGIAESVERIGRRAGLRATGAFVAILIAWNAGLLVQYGTEMIPREEAVPWSEVIANQFTRVPAWIAARFGL